MPRIFYVLILVMIAGIFFHWWVNRAHKRKQAGLDQEIREGAHAEREKQLQEAKDIGSLDRWHDKN
jgi:uncharacterized membrane protein